MKKFLLISLSLLVIASATACSSDKTEKATDEASSTEATQTEGTKTEQPETEKTNEYEGTTYKLGETVSTQILEFTLDRADLSIAMVNTIDENYALPKEYNPEEDKNNPFVAPKGTTYVPLTFTLNNLDRATLDIDLVDSNGTNISIIYNGETYTCNWWDNDIHYCYELFEDGGYNEYTYGNILMHVGEKRTFRAYLELPTDVEDLNSDFIITFDIADVNNTFVEYAYKVTGEDRAVIIEKDRQAAKEKRKRIEEMNAVELAELTPEKEAELVRFFRGWDWQYTDDNNCRYDVKFVDDTNITVKLTVGNSTITNSGTYSFRNKVVYIRYQNGGEAKLPYVEHDGNITVFPIVGMDKSGTYEFRNE